MCGLGACGNVTFVDAPFAPRHINVIYSSQENVTVVRWRMAAEQADSSVTYQLADAAGNWQTIDFAASLFPGGVAPCGNGGGICAQIVLPGHYQLPTKGTTPVRTLNPTYGTSPGNTPSLIQYVDKTLMLTSTFRRNNQILSAKIDDVIGGDGTFVFPRSLERSVWDRRGVCVPGFFPPEAQFVPVSGLGDPWPAPPSLSATGRYCAGVRALPANGSPGADDQVALDTIPDVIDGNHSHTVKTELTPFTYQIILDLSIPVADLCPAAINTIQETVTKTLGVYSELRPLPVHDLSADIDPETGMAGTPCRQSPLRALDPAGMAKQVKDAAATWPEQHQRYFLLYFNNLRVPLPTPLVQSLSDFTSDLFNPPPPGDFQVWLWPFGSAEMAQSFGGWSGQPTLWTSATDPTFAQALKDYGSQELPLISEVDDPSVPIPLLEDEQDAQTYDGGLIRLCTISVSPEQNPVEMASHDANGNLIRLPMDTQYPVHGDDPPAYFLDIPPVNLVSKRGFTPHQAKIRYEICTRYCDHPFTADSGVAVLGGWIGSNLCMGPS